MTDQMIDSCPIDGPTKCDAIIDVRDGGNAFRLVRCRACGLVMISPQPTTEILNGYYSRAYYGQAGGKFIPLIQQWRLRSANKRTQGVTQRMEHTGSVLDVGCAGGLFLSTMKQRGWNAVGIESTDTFSTSPYLRGVKFLVGDLIDQRLAADEFLVVTLWHVIEHIVDPNQYLDEIYRIMKTDGLLVMTMPNIASWQARLFGRRWFHLDVPRHVFHYSPRTIGQLVRRHGFTVEATEHFSLEYNPYGYIQSALNFILPKQNLLYEALKNSGGRWYRFLAPQVVISILLLPILIPLGLIASVAESLAGHGGTIQVYARKQSTGQDVSVSATDPEPVQPERVSKLGFSGERVVPDRDKLQYTFLRHLVVYQWAARLVSKKNVVDCGSGEGYGSFELAKTATSVIGLDQSPHSIDHACRAYHHEKLSYISANLQHTLPLPASSSEAVTSFQVIEHLRQPADFLHEVSRILRPDGFFIVSTPNKITFSPDGVLLDPYHYIEYTSQTLADVLRKNFQHVKILSLTGNSTVQALLQQDILTAKRLVRLDFFRVFRWAPKRLLQLLYGPALNVMRSLVKLSMNNRQLAESDFIITSKPTNVSEVLDVIAVCWNGDRPSFDTSLLEQ